MATISRIIAVSLSVGQVPGSPIHLLRFRPLRVAAILSYADGYDQGPDEERAKRR